MFSLRLFGTLRVQIDNDVLDFSQYGKARELLCYILLHRQQPHARNVLAGRLWADCEQAQSRKYLRQSLWQLRQIIRTSPVVGDPQLLNISSDSISWSATPDVWVDIVLFEAAFALAEDFAAEQIDENLASAMHDAIALYDGDLLEGWYQDWCIFHRERLQNMYLGMLEQLMDYYELRREYERALVYGGRLLQQDRARECVHVRVMRLRYLSGDRIGALRQYQRCVEALDQELSRKAIPQDPRALRADQNRSIGNASKCCGAQTEANN
jgi:DNA-binding SARP family transcriptional activator